MTMADHSDLPAISLFTRRKRASMALSWALYYDCRPISSESGVGRWWLWSEPEITLDTIRQLVT